MLKIRLRRMGAIRQPHYRIVVADARSPRDGRFVESLGHYNPRTEPATIHIDVAKYEEWKKKGAQPTDAVASLVKQYNRRMRNAPEGQTGPEVNRQTRAASTKGIMAAPVAEAPAVVEEVDEAPVSMAGDEAEASVTDAPMNEAMAEATRDDGEGSDAIAGTPVEDSAPDNTDAALLEETTSTGDGESENAG